MRKLSTLFFVLLSAVSFSCLAVTAAPAQVGSSPSAAVVQVSEKSATVNINVADAETLQRELAGVGKVKAEAIVAYREQNGPFASVDQLLEVKGIGKALLERNRGKLSLE